jgi:hypothetical protein
MPSNKHVIALRTDDETYNTLYEIAQKEHRSMSNLCEHIIKEYMNNYDAELGGTSSISSKGTSPSN